MQTLFRINPPPGGYLGRSRKQDERLLTLHQSLRRVDRLYGCVYTTPLLEKLCGLPLIRDTRGRAQSSVPNQLTMTGDVCSTFEHNVSSAFLGEVALYYQPELREVVPHLPVILLVHDSAGPPFRHFTELIMVEILGYGHEGILYHYLDSADGEKIEKWTGCSRDLIQQGCTGEHQLYGPLVAGSLDLDSLDNVIRFLVSKGLDYDGSLGHGYRLNGIPPREWFSYDPREVAKSYRIVDDTICLDYRALPHVRGYAWQRQLVYDHVLFRHHGSVQAMLTSALQMAYERGQIPVEFFRFSDEQALKFLLTRTAKPVRTIMERLFRLEPYRHALTTSAVMGLEGVASFPHLASLRAKLGRPMASAELGKLVADHLNMPRHNVAVNVQAKDKRFKEIKLPICGPDGKLSMLNGADYLYGHPLNAGIFKTEAYRIDVYLHKGRRLNDDDESQLQSLISRWVYT